MQKILPWQNKRLHQLLNETGLVEEKKDLVRDYSRIGAESSKDLLIGEATSLIQHLESLVPDKHDPSDAMRKKIIMYAHKMRWQLENGKIDMKRLDGWCQLYGRFGKKLNGHTHLELTQLVTQFEQVYESFLKGVAKI